MKKQSTHSQAAKAAKKDVIALIGKERFVSARSESYSMGSSITVVCRNVTPEERKQVSALVRKYQYGHFDGMTDSYEYSNRDESLPQVKFAFANFEYSDELREKAAEFASQHLAFADEHTPYQILTGAQPCGFWAQL